MNTAIQIATIVVLITAAIHFWRSKKKNEYLSSLIVKQMNANEEVKRTLAMGLYNRFKKTNFDTEGIDIQTNLFIKQDPLAFEHFVGRIFEKLYGGDVFVTQGSGDYGVDIEHTREDGLHYGQVKCYKENLSYEPIALVHSNMVKFNAVKGFVVTTSDFSENAREYAKGLNVDLINGIELVELWMESLEEEKNLIKDYILEL